MAELTGVDLDTFSAGFVDSQDLVDAALVAARRYCGWHVSPVIVDDEVTIDGPGEQLLALPTKWLRELNEVTEDGVDVDLADLQWSIPTGLRPKLALVVKRRACWSTKPGAITVKMTHGFTEAEAGDWRRAVLQLADLLGRDAVISRDTLDLKRKQVDDVEYEWFDKAISADARLSALFAQFRILPSP